MTPRNYADFCQMAYDRHRAGSLDINDGAVRAIFVKSQDGIVISFAGTDDEETAEVDVEFLPMSAIELGCFVHHAIWKAVRTAWYEDILHRIEAISRLVPIDICGHSLGGAEALLVGGIMSVYQRPARKIVCFNPPKIAMGSRLGVLIGNVTTIFRHADDPISLLPLGWDWQHPCKPITIGEKDVNLIKDHSLSSCREACPEEFP